jgi:hypothetical protein
MEEDQYFNKGLLDDATKILNAEGSIIIIAHIIANIHTVNYYFMRREEARTILQSP